MCVSKKELFPIISYISNEVYLSAYDSLDDLGVYVNNGVKLYHHPRICRLKSTNL